MNSVEAVSYTHLSGGADRNPFPFIGNLALAVPRLPFLYVLVGMIERAAADAVVGMRRDGDGNRRRGRRRIVVRLRGISAVSYTHLTDLPSDNRQDVLPWKNSP